MANPVQPPFQDPGSTSPLELPEMEKLLTKVENKDDKALNLSKSLSGALDLEQNGHSLPFKVISEGHRQHSLPGSPSRASSRRASSVATTSYAQDQEAPKDYLILAIASCFCPVWPLNLIPLIFSIMSRSSVQQGDMDGARRLGRLARLLSITFIILGIVIIIVAVTVNFTGSVITVNGRTENYVLDTPSGVEASLECAVQNPTSDEELLWYRGDGIVDLKTGNKINSSSICVSPIRADDDGVRFTCKLQSDQAVSVSVVLNVTFPPVLSGDDFQTVEEDSDVSLVCNVKSNPQAQMEWRKDNNVLVLEKGRHQIQETSESFQLSITKVKKSDNGTYSCIASSTLKVETRDFHLVVTGNSS
ncbi:Transmembrane and immunoglobulin domain-containing protein 1 [Microtus ochrogaster]|nr:Transmembrane and immunoglobulin domain-containing protein 1 [Microtus ochrogaster]